MPSVGRALLVVVQSAASAVREVSEDVLRKAWRDVAVAAAAEEGVELGDVPQVGVVDVTELKIILQTAQI
jgi:hypothetical protein